jgi:hypothetical protein
MRLHFLKSRACLSGNLQYITVYMIIYMITRALVECALTRTLFKEVMHAYQCVKYLGLLLRVLEKDLNGASASARTQIRLLALIREVNNSV